MYLTDFFPIPLQFALFIVSHHSVLICRCLKLYCQCFALSTHCGQNCKCQTCHNTELHTEAIKKARKSILERNPIAFFDKFRGSPNSSPFRPGVAPQTASWQPTQSHGSSPLQGRQPRVNKLGCKCRRSFCLKKVRRYFVTVLLSLWNYTKDSLSCFFFVHSIVNAIKMKHIVVRTANVRIVRILLRRVTAQSSMEHHKIRLV